MSNKQNNNYINNSLRKNDNSSWLKINLAGSLFSFRLNDLHINPQYSTKFFNRHNWTNLLIKLIANT